jgi:GNAT superfamily N-acetyltransferase
MNPDFVIYADHACLDREWIVQAIRAEYWGAWMNATQINRAIDRSLCFGIYKRGVVPYQVGFARVVTDGAAFSSVTDVVIREAWRGKGLGSLLMQAIVIHPDVRDTICILGTRNADRFFQRFGFLRNRPIMQRDPNPI